VLSSAPARGPWRIRNRADPSKSDDERHAQGGIVVTGATGFVGANLAQRLLQDHPDARLTLLLREENGT